MQHLVRDPNAWSAISASYNDSGRARLTPFSELALAWARDVLDGVTTLEMPAFIGRGRKIGPSPRE